MAYVCLCLWLPQEQLAVCRWIQERNETYGLCEFSIDVFLVTPTPIYRIQQDYGKHLSRAGPPGALAPGGAVNLSIPRINFHNSSEELIFCGEINYRNNSSNLKQATLVDFVSPIIIFLTFPSRKMNFENEFREWPTCRGSAIPEGPIYRLVGHLNLN